MRTKATNVNPVVPTSRPFFHGYWTGALLGPGAFTNLPITTVVKSQGGMRVANDGNGVAGCRIPVPGIYSIGAMSRADATNGPNYIHFQIVVNGTGTICAIHNNASISGVYYPYGYSQLWTSQVLMAGDVLTLNCYSSGYNTYWFGGETDASYVWEGSGLRVLYESPWTGEP